MSRNFLITADNKITYNYKSLKQANSTSMFQLVHHFTSPLYGISKYTRLNGISTINKINVIFDDGWIFDDIMVMQKRASSDHRQKKYKYLYQLYDDEFFKVISFFNILK